MASAAIPMEHGEQSREVPVEEEMTDLENQRLQGTTNVGLWQRIQNFFRRPSTPYNDLSSDSLNLNQTHSNFPNPNPNPNLNQERNARQRTGF